MANDTKIKATLLIDGEAKFKQAISESNKKLSLLGSEMKNTTASFALNEKSVKSLTAKNEVLYKSVDAQNKKVSSLSGIVKELTEKYGESDNRTVEWTKKLNYAEAQLKTTQRQITENNKAIDDMNTAMKREKVDKWGQGFSDADKVLREKFVQGVKIATAAVAAMGTATAVAVKAGTEQFSNFDDGIRQVVATMGLTGSAAETTYTKLYNAAQMAGQTTKFTARQSADALNYLALAGYNADKAVTALPVVLNLAQAGAMDLAKASDLATDSMATLQLEATQENLTHFGDQLAKTASTANANISQLGESILTVGATANVLKGGTDELNTALGVLANRGTKGSEAGTVLRNVILALSAATPTAQKELDRLGLTALDANGNMRPLNETFADFNKKMEKMSDGEKMSSLQKIFNRNDIADVQNLMDGVNKEWGTLESGIKKCDGAMAQMATTLEGGIGGSTRSLESSFESLQITFGKNFGDSANSIIQTLSGEMDKLNGKIKNGFGEETDKAIKQATKSINQFIVNVIPTVESGLKFLSENGDTLVSIGKGAAAGAISYKVLSTAIGLATKKTEGLKTATIALNIVKNLKNPVMAATMAAAGLIAATVAITAKIKAEKAALAQANLEAHFGKISLSMEETNTIARKLVDDGNFSKLEETVSGFAKTEEYLKSMQTAMDEINKLNWKVSVGMKLTEDEKEAYKQNITSFINEANNTLSQQQYSINLALNVLGFDNNSDITSGMNKFYTEKQKELADLGKKLQDAVNAGFEDGLLTIDEANAITTLQNQMASITEKMANAELDSKLDLIKLKFSGAELTPESQQEMQKQINEAIANASENYDKSFIEASAALQVQLDEGKISQKEFDKQMEDLHNGLQQKLDDLRLKSTDFGLNSIADTFGEECKPAISKMLDYLNTEIESQSSGKTQFNFTDLMRIPNELDETTKANLESLYNGMLPDLEGLKHSAQSYIDAGKEVPGNIAKGIMDIEAIGAISGNADSLYTIIGSLAKESDPRFQEMLKEFENIGTGIPENIIKGIEINGNKVASKIGESLSGSTIIFDKSKAVGEDIITEINNGMQNNARFLTARLGILADDSSNDFGEKSYSQFKASGIQLVDGAIAGVKARAPEFMRAIAEVANNGAGAFKNANEQHSPSKRYERMTSFCVDGAILGFEKNTDKFKYAVTSFAQKGMGAYNMSLNTPVAGSGGFSAQSDNYYESRQMVNLDYDKLAACMVNALTGVSVECDKRQFGRLVSEVT